MFSTQSWHDSDFMDEGDTWDEDLDPEYDPRNTTVPAWTVMGAAVYKSLLDYYGPKPLPAINPAFVGQYKPYYNNAVGLAEIGLVQQMPQLGPTPKGSYSGKGTTPGKTYAQYWEYGETFAWVIGTAAAIAVAGMIGGGPKGRSQGRYGRSSMGTPGVGYSFSMAQNPAYAFMYGKTPLRSLTTGVYGQLWSGYVPQGTEAVKETAVLGTGAELGQGTAAAHGLYGYI